MFGTCMHCTRVDYEKRLHRDTEREGKKNLKKITFSKNDAHKK